MSEHIFPRLAGHSFTSNSGLTKRELFAAMAMQGILSGLSSTYSMWWDENAKSTAVLSVERADALIAELAKLKGMQ